MKLAEILARECVRVPLEATDKAAAITELVDLLDRAERIHDRDTVLKAVLDRERAASTGIGNGLAIPHGKCDGCTDLTMAVGKPAAPIDFASKDGKPVNVIVLLASPVDKVGPHIEALAHIARLMRMDDFRRSVERVGSADELYDLIISHDR